jgi:16S rRNA (guanine1516-N2)-methyltransferase
MISVLALAPEFQPKAEDLAKRLELPFNADTDLYLVVGERLELREANSQTGPVYVDFETLANRPRQSKDLIAKAVGVKGSYRPTVIDATAGLGQDAFTLASYGCKVLMLERSPVIAALLEDGLERAKGLETVSRLSLQVGDAKGLLLGLEKPALEKPAPMKPDVVYLDPMYPDLGKSAAKRKEMRLFRDLVGDDTDISELFEIAVKVASKRVVIKRPLKAPELARPNTSFAGRTIRFDIYVNSSK